MVAKKALSWNSKKKALQFTGCSQLPDQPLILNTASVTCGSSHNPKVRSEPYLFLNILKVRV